MQFRYDQNKLVFNADRNRPNWVRISFYKSWLLFRQLWLNDEYRNLFEVLRNWCNNNFVHQAFRNTCSFVSYITFSLFRLRRSMTISTTWTKILNLSDAFARLELQSMFSTKKKLSFVFFLYQIKAWWHGQRYWIISMHLFTLKENIHWM